MVSGNNQELADNINRLPAADLLQKQPGFLGIFNRGLLSAVPMAVADRVGNGLTVTPHSGFAAESLLGSARAAE